MALEIQSMKKNKDAIFCASVVILQLLTVVYALFIGC